MKFISLCCTLTAVQFACGLFCANECPCGNTYRAGSCRAVVNPRENPEAVLHNPDMGWVLYENYPVDADLHGSSTLLALPRENFDVVDSVAIMFSWQDIEKRLDQYDFSKVDFAYDYWTRRGKAIQLRLSSESLLWWENRNPSAGKGVPDYVVNRLAPEEKQTRELDGAKYIVVDARNTYYKERLAKFLWAVDAHFSSARPVTLIDLRGFGVWGEWHSGFKYPTIEDRRGALTGIIDLWSEILCHHRLALSGSFDPDGPDIVHEGPTKQFNSRFTRHYSEFVKYSAFDYALTKCNIVFRRDGCGGAVHSNERKLNDDAFRRGRGPMFSEFMDGYNQSKKGGDKWIAWKVNDALSLHPNYVSLLGWQSHDALDFIKERPDLIRSTLNQMGYRLVPTRIEYPKLISAGIPFAVDTRWINRGVGRALRDYELRLALITHDGNVVATVSAGSIETSRWVKGKTYTAITSAVFTDVPSGNYELAIGLRDPETRRVIKIPLADGDAQDFYRIGAIRVTTDMHPARAVR